MTHRNTKQARNLDSLSSSCSIDIGSGEKTSFPFPKIYTKLNISTYLFIYLINYLFIFTVSDHKQWDALTSSKIRYVPTRRHKSCRQTFGVFSAWAGLSRRSVHIQGAPKLLGLCNKTTLAPKLYKIQQI